MILRRAAPIRRPLPAAGGRPGIRPRTPPPMRATAQPQQVPAGDIPLPEYAQGMDVAVDYSNPRSYTPRVKIERQYLSPPEET